MQCHKDSGKDKRAWAAQCRHDCQGREEHHVGIKLPRVAVQGRREQDAMAHKTEAEHVVPR